MSDFGAVPPARSALTLRLVLAVFGLVISVGAAISFVWFEVPLVFVAMAVVAAVIAVIDIVVIVRRKLHGEPG